MHSIFLNKIIAVVLLVLLPSVISAATITWDVMRRKTQDTDNNSNLQLVTMGYEFDKLSRMTKQTQKIGSGTTQNVIRYFDTFGHRTRITYPHGRNVDTTFTALHQVDEIKTDVGAGIVTVANYDYLYDSGLDKRPLVSKNVLHSGTDTRVDFAYDSMGRVTKKNWVDISATTTLSGFEYTYNLFGNRLTDNQLDRSQDSHTYHYDSAQRFTKMERGTIGGTPTFYQGYTLDALANWSSFNNNGTTESRSHDVMNAITFRGATSLSHDLNGNLTNDGNQKYIWDELNRLVEVRDSGNNIICDYYYNADNLRVEKHHAGGAKEQFYYDGATVLVETDGSQAKVREYVNGGQYIDEVILVVNGSTYNYYMSDLRYCVTGFVDSTGAVVERARYDGYGKRTLLDTSYTVITTANVNQSYGYTGIRHDNESGLQYYRARYFDDDLGRFINRDPLGYVDGLNLYRGYFIINRLDPSGKTVSNMTNGETVDLSQTSYENYTVDQAAYFHQYEAPAGLTVTKNFQLAVSLKCENKLLKVSGSNTSTIYLFVESSNTDFTLLDHEKMHQEVDNNTWNELAASLNALELTQNAAKCCCESALNYAKTLAYYYQRKNERLNAEVHTTLYGPGGQLHQTYSDPLLVESAQDAYQGYQNTLNYTQTAENVATTFLNESYQKFLNCLVEF